jgi:hypothetical protein
MQSAYRQRDNGHDMYTYKLIIIIKNCFHNINHDSKFFIQRLLTNDNNFFVHSYLLWNTVKYDIGIEC